MLGNPIIQTLSENAAMRLFNNFMNTPQTETTNSTPSSVQCERTAAVPLPVPEQKSVESIRSSNEFGNSCRICRWNRSDMQILQCPCNCKGSVVSSISFIAQFHLKLCFSLYIFHNSKNNGKLRIF